MTEFGTPPAPHAAPPAETPTLPIAVTETDEDVLRGLAQALEHEALMRTAANKAANALKAAVKATKAAYEHAAAFYATSRQVVMVFSTGGTTPDDAEDPE